MPHNSLKELFQRLQLTQTISATANMMYLQLQVAYTTGFPTQTRTRWHMADVDAGSEAEIVRLLDKNRHHFISSMPAAQSVHVRDGGFEISEIVCK